MGTLYAALVDKVTTAVSLDDLLRAELVLAVSALDCYVHDVVRIGMTKAFQAPANEPDAFLRFAVPIGFMKKAVLSATIAGRATLFEAEVRRINGYKAFQSSKNVAYALRLLGIKSLFDKASKTLGMTPADARNTLDLIVDRRNRIAHEADIDPGSGGATRFPIDLETTRRAVGFLDRFVHAVHNLVTSELKSLS